MCERNVVTGRWSKDWLVYMPGTSKPQPFLPEYILTVSVPSKL